MWATLSKILSFPFSLFLPSFISLSPSPSLAPFPNPRNVYNWRVKETERMRAIVTELTKLGATVEEGRDFCIVHPLKQLNANVAIDTYDDHRMAMCFSLAACGGVPVVINDPKCVRKTFPDYFERLAVLSK